MLKKPDIKKGEKIIGDLLEWLKIPITDSTKDTPKRVARMYVNELCSGMYVNPPKIAKFDSDTGMVCVTDITFTSLCEHHLLPVIGKCGIVYLADDKVIGLSKLARIVRHISARPGLQEIMTNQIVKEVMRLLKPRGVYVAVSAEHLCITIRGVKAFGSRTNTASYLGDIDRNEAIQLLEVNKFFK